ncbi:MAG: glycogen debranching protein GlgX [Methylococcales bacterium]
MIQYSTQTGKRYPPGATTKPGGINFCIFCRHATDIELLLYERCDSIKPFQIINLDPDINRTFFFWHVFVENLPPETAYTWRVGGPDDTRCTGFRFDKRKQLLDPWANAVSDSLWDRNQASDPDQELPSSMRAIVADDSDYNWEGDQPINRSSETSIIYEMHVGGFTRHKSANVQFPGTFRGLIEKISYLKQLGITAVELLPIMAFDEQDIPKGTQDLGLKNYWGYSTHSFYSPHPGYCVTPEKGTHGREFRDLVKALHKAGISVILDVVFNHTAEGGADGPTINFKGFGNQDFYHLDDNDRRIYKDYTGCGNTVNCNHPMMAALIVECLEYWVREFHIDGFRFDLASIFSRGEDGEPMHHAPVLWNIEFSDVLAHTKLIAEAWDAAGLYQVGNFPGFRWSEWNGSYRDVMRRFVRGDHGLISEVANRLSGSSDFYKANGRLPINSVNFVTCHDGFTLNDLVSYEHKHNEDNGENNQDGSNENYSHNYGHEGPVDSVEIENLRRCQAKNVIAILLLSQGVPMLLAGDEVLKSQGGNNNAYCQDNGVSWFDWQLLDKNHDMLRFVQQMIAFRKRHPNLMRRRFLTGKPNSHRPLADIVWHGYALTEPLWADPDACYLAFTLDAVSDSEEPLYVMINMGENSVEAPLPIFPDYIWYLAVDTSHQSPQDIVEPTQQIQCTNAHYVVKPRSVVVLESWPDGVERLIQ